MWSWFVEMPIQGKLLSVAALVVATELVLRRVARDTRLYRGWTALFEGIGKVWTTLILAVIYFLSVSLVSLGMRLVGRDLLDRSLAEEPSFWRAHEPNPLEPRRAARHLF